MWVLYFIALNRISVSPSLCPYQQFSSLGILKLAKLIFLLCCSFFKNWFRCVSSFTFHFKNKTTYKETNSIGMVSKVVNHLEDNTVSTTCLSVHKWNALQLNQIFDFFHQHVQILYMFCQIYVLTFYFLSNSKLIQ